jgi:two-component system, chemotaxis family, protein-glutamate methylesterase/glutaminase
VTPTKPVTVIVVDDSIIVRGVVSRLLRAEPQIEVISTAIDGVMAVEHVKNMRPDVVVLDIEMPNMDGLTALPQILKVSPRTKVIMASTLTARNADISMKALALGASDYLQKPSANGKAEMDRFLHELIGKIMALAGRDYTPHITATPAAPIAVAAPAIINAAQEQRVLYPRIPPRALAIASSTGGPQALTTLFTALDGSLRSIPIFVTQHMPPAFTKILATNIAAISGRECHEALDGETVRGGKTYVAPGDYHLLFEQHEGQVKVRLNQGEMINFCRPAADPMIQSLVEIYGAHLLLVVLTGMGQDGLAGATILTQAGGTIVAQDKESSVVWGMPKAIAEAGIASAVLPLSGIAPYLKRAFGEVT